MNTAILARRIINAHGGLAAYIRAGALSAEQRANMWSAPKLSGY